jgi:hypothetical protein
MFQNSVFYTIPASKTKWLTTKILVVVFLFHYYERY